MAKPTSKSSNGSINYGAASASIMTPERRQQMIAEAAYYRAKQRGFDGGDPTQDWLQAEREIDNVLLNVVTEHEQAQPNDRRLPMLTEQGERTARQSSGPK
jgi:hypothetical protein